MSLVEIVEHDEVIYTILDKPPPEPPRTPRYCDPNSRVKGKMIRRRPDVHILAYNTYLYIVMPFCLKNLRPSGIISDRLLLLQHEISEAQVNSKAERQMCFIQVGQVILRNKTMYFLLCSYLTRLAPIKIYFLVGLKTATLSQYSQVLVKKFRSLNNR